MWDFLFLLGRFENLNTYQNKPKLGSPDPITFGVWNL
jgi:hypothetical protein